MIMVKMIG